MKRIIWGRWALIGIGTALVALAGCVVRQATVYPESPPPPPPAVAYDYYYYPDCAVYYYPATGVYFWLAGGRWDSGRRLPPRFVLRPQARVTVRLHSREPWREHAEVQRRYPERARERGRDRGQDRDRRGD